MMNIGRGYALLFLLLSALVLSAQGESKKEGRKEGRATATYDVSEATRQLLYSYAAYCPWTSIQAWNCPFCTYQGLTNGFRPYASVQNSAANTFVFIGSLGSNVIVSFRGTQSDSMRNWIEDLNYAHSTNYSGVPGAFVHSGFLNDYTELQTQLTTTVKNLVASLKATRVFFTGHSLGAALSTLCALDLGPQLNTPFSVYNFGSPRVGNDVFAAYVNSKFSMFRVVNQADIVPHLPSLNMGYHHAAQEVWYTTNTTYKLCDASGEDPNCSDSRLLYGVPNHLTYLGIPEGC